MTEEILQRDSFSYFAHETNPANGLIIDKTSPDCPASIAATGLALAAYPVGIERGFMARPAAVERTLVTLRFFWNSPHGPETDATGYQGFYYHFLDMRTGRRAWQCELSTIDTAFLLAGMLTAASYFDADTADEQEIRTLADALYGRDFEQYPDVDDTSRALVFLQKMAPLTGRKGAAESRKQGLHWLLKRQNSDGGWGAFDQDNIGGRVAKLFTKDLTDSVELFDGSSADNTGHVLAGLGAYGLTAKHSRSVRRAVRFLRRAQDPATGLWEGRWGINTLYGTTQAGTGLLRAGESPQSPYLRMAARTLMSFQNPDGGFGESTLSYLDNGHHGRGASTPTQTGWVLEFLCEMRFHEEYTVSRAVNYLLETRSESEPWRDASVVGTGHPGILYVDYPVYPQVFPVMALANYLEAV